MLELGFSTEKNRYWVRPKSIYFVEFPGSILEIGSGPGNTDTEVFEKKTQVGTVRLLSPTDCIQDRLAVFYHWSDRQSLDQALAVAKKQKFSRRVLRRLPEDQLIGRSIVSYIKCRATPSDLNNCRATPSAP